MRNLLIALSILVASSLMAQEDNWLSYQLSCQVLVEDSSHFSRSAAQWSVDSGGYYTTMSSDYVIIRFPWQKLPDFRQWLDLNSREIYQMDQSSQDLREEILSLRSGIEAREEILERNMEYLDKSNFQGTLALEQEIRRLMQEIDTRKGYLRRRENDRQMVQAVVNISFLNNSLPERGYSSFEWINYVDFFDFINSYQAEHKWKRVSFELPDGFALERDGSLWKALSAEGIKLQLRWLDNYPEMDQDFWTETLHLECLNRGYLPLNEKSGIETNNGSTMIWMDWGIPYGQQDFHYITAFIVKGKRLLVLEAAGPVLLMEPYIENIKMMVETKL